MRAGRGIHIADYGRGGPSGVSPSGSGESELGEFAQQLDFEGFLSRERVWFETGTAGWDGETLRPAARAGY